MREKYDIKVIIEGCLKNQPKYQRALVDQFSGLLFSICKRYLNDADFARDMVQESLMRIFNNLEKFDPYKGTFASWITTISIRLCLTKLRKKKLSIISIQDQDQTEGQKLESNAEYALDKLETSYLLEMVRELPDGYRAVFNMAAIDGFSHADIATHLNINEEASRSRLSRAKAILRKRIIKLNNQELWVNSI